MGNYKIPVISIKRLSQKKFCYNSFSARDYRVLAGTNTNFIPLSNLLVKKEKVGKEIGSDNYMPKSKYRFLKTVNVSSNFLLDESSLEFCKPSNKVFPKKEEILIVKDGGSSGLGEACIYPYDNKENTDSLSAGLISIGINQERRYYVLGMLKSQHFRDYVDLNTAQGSTIRHSKKIALNYPVIFPTKTNNDNPAEVERMVSMLVQNIISKEEQIKKKQLIINLNIRKELLDNQKKGSFKYSYPRLSEIIKKKRFDTGLYGQDFKELEFIIKNYSGGTFNIPLEKFKSGATPEIRVFNPKNKKFKWVTPTNISDEGFYVPLMTIDMPVKHNINKDCVLIVNRTSRGKKGEFVGISCYYDLGYYGKGHHNQGIYQIKELDKTTALFLVALLNCEIYRQICGCVTIGSKMKEMKSGDFSKLDFPNFPQEKKEEISKLYYNESKKRKEPILDNYLEIEEERNKELGIFQLNRELFYLREKVEELIKKIIMGEKIDLNFVEY